MTTIDSNVPATRSDTQPWRLLIVVNVSWFFVMHRLPIAQMARKYGVDVHVACGEGEGAAEIKAHGFPFHELPLTRTPLAPLRDLRALWALVRLYRRLKPDIVHHVTLKPILYGSIAARIARVPAVLNAFAGLGYTFSNTSRLASLRSWAIEKLLTFALRLPRQKVVFENNDDRQLLVSREIVKPGDSLVISGIGVDLSEYAVSIEPEGTPCVVLASRMLREKGVEYFVEAARRLRSRGVEAKFLLVGTPDPFNPGSISEDTLKAWNAEGVVEWQGFRKDMPEVLRRAAVVCLPTYYREGVPRILMEAAASGRAIVATDMPGCRDIVRDGINGFIVPPHDVDSLADAIERLLSSRALRAQYGAAGRALVEQKFALPIVLDEFWRLYCSLRTSAC